MCLQTAWRLEPNPSSAYRDPETAVEDPSEFVSCTNTVPIAAGSPENVNGTCRLNAPPAVCPLPLANHGVALDPIGFPAPLMLNDVPVNSEPGWAVKLNVAP